MLHHELQVVEFGPGQLNLAALVAAIPHLDRHVALVRRRMVGDFQVNRGLTKMISGKQIMRLVKYR